MEFTDPAEPAQRLRVDLTWLTSGYACIFGDGCRGLRAQAPDDGCCALGAHFCDDDDLQRVRGIVDRLTPSTWQFADRAPSTAGDAVEGAAGDGTAAADAQRPWWTDLEEGETKTAVVDGACVLLNRAGFAGGSGCALHGLALADDVAPLQYKPDVCWQLPIYRDYRTVELPDDTSYLEITIGEYERGRWGPGGHDFDWYCTASAQAHEHVEPLFRSHEAELTELVGAAAYAELVRRCEAHLAATHALAATPGGRRLLPLFVHPATLVANAFVADEQYNATDADDED
ncbi:hypothetical protein KILIM_039_00610 [Kineosphaera limosa NBRC 100340]|uniref:DUF3109 family protein n=1 Tax=Kineosphaera limosa NBRC 100340 TaxID=1184609 RepID=K6WRN4_9MICO|nr:hypothetical protein KILIM_039_00610 [Kineosphaera limosa NBRC 100340]